MSAYTPIEDILDRPRVRLLRAMRWLDWIEPRDLFDQIELVESSVDCNRDRDRHWRGISALHAEGAIEQRSVRQMSKGNGAQRKWIEKNEYRITKAGKDLLRRMLEAYEHRLGEGVAA